MRGGSGCRRGGPPGLPSRPGCSARVVQGGCQLCCQQRVLSCGPLRSQAAPRMALMRVRERDRRTAEAISADTATTQLPPTAASTMVTGSWTPANDSMAVRGAPAAAGAAVKGTPTCCQPPRLLSARL